MTAQAAASAPQVASARRQARARQSTISAARPASRNGSGSRSVRVRIANPNSAPDAAQRHGPSPAPGARQRLIAHASAVNAAISRNAPSGSDNWSPVAPISGGEGAANPGGPPPP